MKPVILLTALHPDWHSTGSSVVPGVHKDLLSLSLWTPGTTYIHVWCTTLRMVPHTHSLHVGLPCNNWSPQTVVAGFSDPPRSQDIGLSDPPHWVRVTARIRVRDRDSFRITDPVWRGHWILRNRLFQNGHAVNRSSMAACNSNCPSLAMDSVSMLG